MTLNRLRDCQQVSLRLLDKWELMDALIELFLKCEKNSLPFFQSSPSSHIRVKVVALNDFADIIRFCNSIFLPFFLLMTQILAS